MAKLTKEACRAARALLGLTTQQFAAQIGVSPTTVNGIEAGTPVRESTERKIIEALRDLGVEITNGDGTGARLVFVEARAHQRDNGEWAVMVRWRRGDPVEIVSIETARAAAIEAKARGDTSLATALSQAADDASRQETAAGKP